MKTDPLTFSGRLTVCPHKVLFVCQRGCYRPVTVTSKQSPHRGLRHVRRKLVIRRVTTHSENIVDARPQHAPGSILVSRIELRYLFIVNYYRHETVLNGVVCFVISRFYSSPSKLIILSNICFKKTIIKIKPPDRIKWSLVNSNGSSRMSYKLGIIMHNDAISPIHGLILLSKLFICIFLWLLSSSLMVFLIFFCKTTSISKVIFDKCHEVDFCWYKISIR